MDDTESVDFREARFLFDPDLDCATPSVWWAVVVDREVDNHAVDINNPFVVVVLAADCFVMTVVSARGGRRCAFV